MENKKNNQVVAAKERPAKRKYLIITGIAKAIVCITATVFWIKYLGPSSAAIITSLIIAVAAIMLFICDMFMVAIIQNGKIWLYVKDALFVNFVAIILLGLSLCCIIIFFAITCERSGSMFLWGSCTGVVVLIPFILIGVSVLYLIVTPLTVLVIILMQKGIKKRLHN